MGVSAISTTDTSDVDAELGVCKKAIAWIWDYVRMQIKRKSREHTREMHSVIVAAYHCLVMLLVSKPQLLRDKDCLKVVTQCVEIGISGSSSYPDQKQVASIESR